MNPAIWRDKLRPIYPHIRHVLLHGGEPTSGALFRDFVDLIRSTNDIARFSLFTNGLLFDEYWSSLMLERGGFANFSLNAVSPGTYAKIHKYGDHSSVIANLERLIAARAAHPSSRLSIETSFVITDDNLGEVADFIELHQKTGIDRIRFFFDHEHFPHDQSLIRAQLDRGQALRRQSSRPIVWGLEIFEACAFRTPISEELLESHGCRRTFNNIYVSVHGNVSFCNFLEPRPLGNLNEQSLEEIWNTALAREQRRCQDRGDWTYCISAYCGPRERTAFWNR
jgi:MoaA/NifB/PqqE/SkfB family radical SAM enzyme